MATLTVLLTVLFVIVCILLVVVILLQPHHSESGLAGAFGGGGGMDSFLGVKAITVATRVTVVLAVIFLLLAIILAQLPHTSSGRGLISSEPVAPKEAPVKPGTAEPVTTLVNTPAPPEPVNPSVEPKPSEAPENK